MEVISCRVFKIDFAWSYYILYIPLQFNLNDLKYDNILNKIKKHNYIGKYNIPIDILNLYTKTDKYYYVINLNE